jgi:hypothetical protein
MEDSIQNALAPYVRQKPWTCNSVKARDYLLFLYLWRPSALFLRSTSQDHERSFRRLLRMCESSINLSLTIGTGLAST